MKPILQINLRSFAASGFRGILLSVSTVPFVMAALAERSAPQRVGVTFVPIHVGDRQHYFAASLRMQLSILSAAIRMLRCSLATVFCSLKEACPEGLPLFRVRSATDIVLHALGANGHVHAPVP
jgi:hypothetical protein